MGFQILVVVSLKIFQTNSLQRFVEDLQMEHATMVVTRVVMGHVTLMVPVTMAVTRAVTVLVKHSS